MIRQVAELVQMSGHRRHNARSQRADGVSADVLRFPRVQRQPRCPVQRRRSGGRSVRDVAGAGSGGRAPATLHDPHQNPPGNPRKARHVRARQAPGPAAAHGIRSARQAGPGRQGSTEHVGFEGTEPTTPDGDGLDKGDEPLSIVDEWGGDYPPGTPLFCAKFDAEDYNDEWGEGDFSEGATVAIRRGSGVPPQGWIIRHAHLSDLERTKAIIEKHASPWDALAILYSLKDSAFDAFVEAWGKDGGMAPGKSGRSARRSANRKRR